VNTPGDLVDVMERLRRRVKRLRFGPPVAYVYNPLEYAWSIAQQYFERFGRPPKEVLFLGMNPGPFGMGQTGVPFGEVGHVRDFLGLRGEVGSPRRVHAKRPIEGLDCARSEVSGLRLWGAIQKRHPSPETFFERAFIINYCPLLFLGESGVNLTPDKLAKPDRLELEAVCDRGLAEVLRVLEPRHVVGIGIYAAKRALCVVDALPSSRARPALVTMPHPSPASPTANRGWLRPARKALSDAGLVDLI
jgi:single-strand selective monofunctional uracil DNA glycosylase